MKRSKDIERGSALVTVLGISAILTLAAGGLLATSAMSQSDEDNAWKRVRCFHDLESSMMLGTRWLRQVADWSAFPPFTQEFSLQNHCGEITMTVRHSADPNIKTVEARYEGGANTIRLAWDVTTPLPVAPPDRPVRIVNWRKLDGGGP